MSEHTVSDPSMQHEARPAGWRRVPVSRVPKGEGGQVGGVVAGISRAYGFDLRSTRIAVVIATIVLPVLLLVYIAAWVLLPDGPAQAQPLEDIVRDRRRLPVMLAIALVLVVGSLGSFGAWFLFRGAPWGLALIAVGVLLWVSTTLGKTTTPAVAGSPVPPPGTDDTTPMPAISPLTPDSGEGPVTTSFAPPAPTLTAAPVVRRRRWPIGSVSFVIAMVFVGVTSAVEAVTSWNAPALWIIVTALGILTAGLAISAIVNRSWLMILPLLAVGSMMTMLTIAQPHLDGGAGERTIVPTTIEAASQIDPLGAGELEIDLRSLPTGSEAVTVQAEVGMGRLHVIVPNDVQVQLNTELGMGVVQLDGNDLVEGVRQTDSRTVQPLTGEAVRTIVLDLTMGMGQIDVERAG